MKELSDQLIQKAIQYLQSAEAFAKKEVPIFIEEILKFDFYEAQFWTVFVVLILVISILVTIKLCSLSENLQDEFWSVLAILSIIVSFIALTVALSVIPDQYLKMKKIEVAPRVYLLDKFTGK